MLYSKLFLKKVQLSQRQKAWTLDAAVAVVRGRNPGKYEMGRLFYQLLL